VIQAARFAHSGPAKAGLLTKRQVLFRTPMKPLNLFIYAITFSLAANAHAFQADQKKIERKQAELDQACESARLVKLEPIREQAFNECINSKRSTDTPEDCRRKTSGINANRQGGSPKFYDLPACVEAFKHRKENPKKS